MSYVIFLLLQSVIFRGEFTLTDFGTSDKSVVGFETSDEYTKRDSGESATGDFETSGGSATRDFETSYESATTDFETSNKYTKMSSGESATGDFEPSDKCATTDF